MRFVKIRTEDNCADVLTKPLKNPLFHSIVSSILFQKLDWNADKDDPPIPCIPK